MADTIKRNIFISHIHEDDHRLEPLKDLLRKQGYEVRDGSINSSKPNDAESPDYIKYQVLKPRIEWASAFIVLVSPDSKESEYVNWEIECANRLNKRIVGVWDHGEAECDLPEALERYHDAMVGWQGPSIVGAIEGEINNRKTPKGEDPGRPRDFPRYSC
jgi:Thoeris protein ThsB, TIR-like domain